MRVSAANLRLALVLAVLSVGAGLLYFSNMHAYEAAPYQAGIARSMSMSFSNWLFGAVDPLGTVSIDKIPGSYWIPAIFVKLFGFHSATLIVPNGLATIGAVLAIALAGRRIAKFATASDAVADVVAFGAGAIIIATPIITAVARSNEPESFFLLFMALAFHRTVVALQTAKRSQLIYAGLFIAAAFQTYMIEAWVLWPAIIVAWLTISGKSRARKFADLLIAGSISLVASLLWIIVVTLTPASARPYLGGTLRNSAWEMVFGYNALGRLSATNDPNLYRSFTPHFAGTPGIFRLFNPQDAGQIAWLIVAAAVAIITLFLLREFDASLVFIGISFVLFYLEYSFVAGMHQYYTALLAMPIAAALAYLVGHGRTWMFILVGLAGVASAFLISSIYPGYFSWLPYLAFAVVVILVVVFGILPNSRGWLGVLLAVALIATPLAWSIDTINRPNSTNPIAGPAIRAAGHPGLTHKPKRVVRSYPQDVKSARQIRDYIKANVEGAPKYRAGVFGAQVSSIITNSTGMEILPIGGFSGFDPVPTYSQFRKQVAEGQLQYVIMGPNFALRKIAGNTANMTHYISANCKVVLDTAFGSMYHCVK